MRIVLKQHETSQTVLKKKNPNIFLKITPKKIFLVLKDKYNESHNLDKN